MRDMSVNVESIIDRESIIDMESIIEAGDIVTMKKPHPCGSRDWEVLRIGADFRLKCLGCGHQVMLPRRQVERDVRTLKKSASE